MVLAFASTSWAEEERFLPLPNSDDTWETYVARLRQENFDNVSAENLDGTITQNAANSDPVVGVRTDPPSGPGDLIPVSTKVIVKVARVNYPPDSLNGTIIDGWLLRRVFEEMLQPKPLKLGTLHVVGTTVKVFPVTDSDLDTYHVKEISPPGPNPSSDLPINALVAVEVHPPERSGSERGSVQSPVLTISRAASTILDATCSLAQMIEKLQKRLASADQQLRSLKEKVSELTEKLEKERLNSKIKDDRIKLLQRRLQGPNPPVAARLPRRRIQSF